MKSRRMIGKLSKHYLLAIVFLIGMSFVFSVHISASECNRYGDMRIDTLNMVTKHRYTVEGATVPYSQAETDFLKDQTMLVHLEDNSARKKHDGSTRQYYNDVQPISNQICTITKEKAEQHGNGSGIIHIGTTTLDHTVVNPLIFLIVLCGYTAMIFGNHRCEEHLC